MERFSTKLSFTSGIGPVGSEMAEDGIRYFQRKRVLTSCMSGLVREDSGCQTRAFENPESSIRYSFGGSENPGDGLRSEGREGTVSAKTGGGFRETSLGEQR